MPQLSCKDVVLGYDGRIVTEDLNFEVNAGDYLCIVGENGAGKSTLIKAILGLKEPMKGKIEFGDGLKQTEIGYLPQQTPVQRDFPASVMEIVLSGCRSVKGAHRFYNRGQKLQRAEEKLRKLNIYDMKKRCYRELSGGQQQRVLLARALCAADRMLLLDEPVAGLDPKVTREMYELIAQLNREGITVIMVSHDIGAAVRYASHILHVSRKPLFFGRKEDYVKTDTGKIFTSVSGGETDA